MIIVCYSENVAFIFKSCAICFYLRFYILFSCLLYSYLLLQYFRWESDPILLSLCPNTRVPKLGTGQCCQFSNFVARFSDFPTPFKSLGTNIANLILPTDLQYIHLFVDKGICYYDVI